MKAEKKSRGFLIFMVIYCVALLTAGFFGLRYLYGYLDEYEKSRPKYVLADYTQKVLGGELPADSFPVLAETDSNIQSDREALEFINGKLSESSFYRLVNECTDERTVYVVKCGGDLIGRAGMTVVGETEHGFPIWEFTDAEFYFEPFLETASVTVPPEYTVTAGGTVLSGEYITEKDIGYNALSDFYAEYPDLPRMVRYETGKTLGPTDLRVYDQSGKEVSGLRLSEPSFLNSLYGAGNYTELHDFTSEFIKRYVTYTANLTGNAAYNYSVLKDMVVPDSELHDRIRLAFDALNYTFTKRADISKEVPNITCDFGDGLYFTDTTYTTDIVSKSDSVTMENSIRLMMTEYSSVKTLRAAMMSTY